MLIEINYLQIYVTSRFEIIWSLNSFFSNLTKFVRNVRFSGQNVLDEPQSWQIMARGLFGPSRNVGLFEVKTLLCGFDFFFWHLFFLFKFSCTRSMNYVMSSLSNLKIKIDFVLVNIKLYTLKKNTELIALLKCVCRWNLECGVM